MENQPAENLLPQLIRWGLFSQIALALMLFGPGTLRFWQGWAFLGVNLVVAVALCVYFYRHDRELLVRRLLRKEKAIAQKILMFLVKMISVIFYLLCGFDHRLGWSRNHLMPVPWWVTWLALGGYAGCHFLFIPVFKANRFAASVIQVESGQTVAAQGPYRFVRHPMYSVSLAVWFWIPFALGSLIALPVAALIAPILILRLFNEEKTLRRELPGYTEYCQRTRYRLIPSFW